FPISILVRSDGKIVVVAPTDGYRNPRFGLVRYLPNGALDSTFGTGGKVTTLVGGLADVTSAFMQPDGKIVAGGSAFIYKGGNVTSVEFALARYNPDGSLDTGFGTGG